MRTLFAAAVLLGSVSSALAQQAPPRDPTPQILAQQEEATLLAAVQADPSSVPALMRLAAFYQRQGNFEKTISTLERAARLQPATAAAQQTVATYYWEKAFKDSSLTPDQKMDYIDRGIAATDRALAIDGDFVDALTYKNILLRMKANAIEDPATKQSYLAEADVLRNRALELQKAKGGPAAAPGVPPPPLAPLPDGQAPIRIGGNVRQPVKTKDVRPVYPPVAQANRVSGVVIMEVVLNAEGRVHDVRVLKGVDVLNQAAVDAVKQWEFEPTLLNGRPVPVIMTVTVSFTVQ